MSAREPMTAYADFGVTLHSPELPNGVRAELAFDLEYYDGGLIVAVVDRATIELTDEDGEAITVDPRLLPLIREALIARMHRRVPNTLTSSWEKMMDDAALHNMEYA
jgi:hypothetical protein